MTSEESYNINDEHSVDDFDPEDSGPYNFRKKPQRSYAKTQNHNNASSREQRRQTRATRNQPTPVNTREDNYIVPVENIRKKYAEHEQMDDEEKPQPEEVSIFSQTMDVILNRRWTQNNEFEYLVKFKNKSHLHTEWLNQAAMINLSKTAKGKINRFIKLYEKKQLELELAGELLPQDDNILFDPSLTQVERILHTTEIFTTVHHKKSNQIKGKWSQPMTIICKKLLNYMRDHTAYGVYFMQPVNLEMYPNYKKMIAQPMDLGTVLNRLYLDVYTKPQDVWRDIGLVWRNCKRYNQDSNSDIRVICDTLRQASIWLYEQWHALSVERFNVMKEEFYEKYPHLVESAHGENKTQQEICQELSLPVKPKENDEGQFKAEDGAKMEVEETQKKEEGEQKMEVEEPPKIEGQTPLVKLEQNAKIQNPSLNPLPALQLNQVKSDKKSEKKSNKSEDMMDDDGEQNQDDDLKHEYDNVPSSEQAEQVDQYLQNNVFLEQKKAPVPVTVIDLNKYDPGELSYVWINPDDEEEQKNHTSYSYIDQQDAKQLNLNHDTPQLFLVKWKGVSYLGATWEMETDISSPSKIQEFKMWNKALDKQSRSNMLLYTDYHEQLAELIINPKKKYKLSNSQIDQMSNVLYSHDISCRKPLPKYNQQNRPKLKNGRELRCYQVESLNWMIEAWYHRRNVILADEMGLGKTVQSLALLNHMFTMENRKGPFLVLAPLTTLEHWKRTVDDWTNMNSICYYDSESHTGRASLRSYQWFYTEVSTKGTVLVSKNLYKVNIIISSYEVFLSDFEVFRAVPIQFVIVDEAHRLKNQNAKILGCLKTLPCKRVLLLTGTPIQNNTDELWTLLNYLQPNAFPRHSEFKVDFGNLKTGQQVERLNMILKPYMLRRMKQDVEQSIPPLHETIVDIEMTTIQKTIYRALYQKNKGMLMKGIVGSNVTTSLNNLEIQLRKCCNHPFLIKEMEAELLKDTTTEDQRITKLLETSGKMTLVDKLLVKFRRQKKKMLIFSQFTYMLTLLQDLLKYRGIKYQKIDGQTKAKQRQVAIDRYNNPTRNRQIFLLSTKAGGVGINLTSANIVIIFDSDWNPQNDVQATARAHRIGQENEVKVFRLITDKTYESEMFQRAVLKLGLDQAIFKGGDFKGSIKDAEDGKNESKNNKEETEILLKMGILGFIKDAPEGENNNFYQNDIDEILAKNSRQAEYSLIKGSYSFDKKKFVSDTCDKQLQLNDPDFWQKVLKNIQTKSQKLSKKMQNSANFSTPSQQQEIMKQLSQCVTQLLNSKVSTNGYNEDDQKTLTQILTLIMSEKSFSKPYRDLAHQWCSDLGKPSRRFKKATLDNIEINKIKNKRNNAPEVNNEENVFVDSDKESDDFNQEPRVFTTRGELDDEKKDEFMKRLCYLCEKPRCSLFCQGYCKRAFHKECKKRVDNGEINYDGAPHNIEPQENKLIDQKLKATSDYRVVCQDCSESQVLCFLCKKKGKYHGAEYVKKKGVKGEKGNVIKLSKKINDDGADDDVIVDDDPAPTHSHNSKAKNEVTKCSTANCAKFYHHACIESYEGKVNFKALDDKSLHFRCSLHYCSKCGISGDTMSITQCIRCPKAYHVKCTDKDKTIKITKKLIICEKHKKKEVKKQATKAAMKEKEEKKPARTSRVEKEEVVEPIVVQDHHDNRDYRSRTRTTARGRMLDAVPPPVTSSFKKYPPTNYQQMNIPRPSEFDYANYTYDWCRYCGTRFSSNFTQGPWGPKTLCTVHYISWKTKKTLILDDYPERPTSPINPSDDQELKYINTNRAKGSVMDYKEIVDSGMK